MQRSWGAIKVSMPISLKFIHDSNWKVNCVFQAIIIFYRLIQLTAFSLVSVTIKLFVFFACLPVHPPTKPANIWYSTTFFKNSFIEINSCPHTIHHLKYNSLPSIPFQRRQRETFMSWLPLSFSSPASPPLLCAPATSKYCSRPWDPFSWNSSLPSGLPNLY